MKKFYIQLFLSMLVFCGLTISANADSVRKLKRQTFYGDAQGTFSNSQATRIIDYLYDGQNRLIRTVETSLSTEYDSSKRTWEITHYNKYEYDANSNLIETSSLTYGLFDYGEWGTNASKDSVFYEYNDLNQCIKETHKYIIYEYTYDDQGRKLTSSKWNISSITGKKSNDLLETYSDFNAQGNPCTITATSPSGKSWNEYTGTIEYDENGNKICEKHFSNDDGWMTVHEEWKYDGDFMTEHISWNVLEGNDEGGTKETYTPVDGDKDKVMLTVRGTDADGNWSDIIGGTDCLYEYGYFDGAAYSPTLKAEKGEDTEASINNVALTFVIPNADCTNYDFDLYRNGIVILQDCAINGTQVPYTADGLTCQVFDDGVKNGFYEYALVVKEKIGQDESGNTIFDVKNSSNIATITLDTELPAVTDIIATATRKDFQGNTYVQISWTNPEYDNALEFQDRRVYFENMQVADSTTVDPTATSIYVNFGNERKKNLYVQTNYRYGRANSMVVTIDADNIVDGIRDITPATSRGEGAIYNAAGQRVDAKVKGIYIKDGKKFVK